MKIFLSWSKNKSRLLAKATKQLIERTLGQSIEFFFSPEMYKGTRVDHEIHENLLQCEKCFVCITSENFKNPWLLYEAGVVYGANYSTQKGGIVIPILFEYIPDWSSWIDKPLNRYVPIQLELSNKEFLSGKEDFKSLLFELSEELGIRLKNFNKNWKIYEEEVVGILKSEQLIPNTCKDLFLRITENDDGSFTVNSPEITSERILFHKGFGTTKLTKLLLDSIVEYQGKRIWFYGRRNKRLLSSENDYFFKYLSEEGIANGVDFKCLFPYPNSDATYKATGKEKERGFFSDLQTCLEKAIMLENKFGLSTKNLFRLYAGHRTETYIISDNAVIYKKIICDGEGYPLSFTNSEFEIISCVENESKSNKGFHCINSYQDIWEHSVPLTKELYNEIYKSIQS